MPFRYAMLKFAKATSGWVEIPLQQHKWFCEDFYIANVSSKNEIKRILDITVSLQEYEIKFLRLALNSCRVSERQVSARAGLVLSAEWLEPLSYHPSFRFPFSSLTQHIPQSRVNSETVQ